MYKLYRKKLNNLQYISLEYFDKKTKYTYKTDWIGVSPSTFRIIYNNLRKVIIKARKDNAEQTNTI